MRMSELDMFGMGSLYLAITPRLGMSKVVTNTRSIAPQKNGGRQQQEDFCHEDEVVATLLLIPAHCVILGLLQNRSERLLLK